MTKKVLEGEIVKDSGITSQEYGEIDFNSMSLPGLLLLTCAIPVVGFIFAVCWFYLAKVKKRLVIFPIIGLVISLFSTVTFIVLRFIFKAIF